MCRNLAFSLLSLDASVRLGSGVYVVREYVVLLRWVATGSSRKSICERLIEVKIASIHGNVMDFCDPGTFDEDFGTLQSPGIRADAQCFKITRLEELASERKTIQA